MHVKYRIRTRSSPRLTVRHRWRLLADRTEMPRHLQMVRAYVALGRRRQDWLAIGSAMGKATPRVVAAVAVVRPASAPWQGAPWLHISFDAEASSGRASRLGPPQTASQA